MKLRTTTIEWEYPAQRGAPAPEVWDLGEAADLMQLYQLVTNGIVVELRAEADTPEALDALRGLLQGAGAGVRLAEAQSGWWLYQAGCEIYKQGAGPGGYFFVNPIPQLGKFPAG